MSSKFRELHFLWRHELSQFFDIVPSLSHLTNLSRSRALCNPPLLFVHFCSVLHRNHTTNLPRRSLAFLETCSMQALALHCFHTTVLASIRSLDLSFNLFYSDMYFHKSSISHSHAFSPPRLYVSVRPVFCPHVPAFMQSCISYSSLIYAGFLTFPFPDFHANALSIFQAESITVSCMSFHIFITMFFLSRFCANSFPPSYTFVFL